ncbi:MAG: YncE family protein [Planctomycetota bacterium]
MHGIAFGDDGHLAFVTSSGANTVTVIDGETLEPVADIPVGRTPLAVAYSRAADLVYVANINDEHLSVIDPSSKSAVGKISTERGTVALRFDPEGRFGFIVNQTAGLVSVLDVATNSIVGGTSVVSEPDQVTFTEKFAYIRNLGSNKITMIDRDRLAREQVVVVDVMIGQKPPVDLPAQIGVADMIVPTPTVGSVMIASAPDRSFYYYAEGMMASMGSFQAYKRFPRGILILDRSLQESAPGVYSTFIRPLRSGLCNVPCVVDQPRVVHCFELRVEAAEGEAAAPTGASVTVKYLFDKPRIRPGGDTKLTFRVLDSATGAPVEGLEDILVMIFKKPGVWQRRQRAKEIGDGAYEIVQSFPESGMHMMLVSIPSRGASFLDLPTVDLPVYTDEEGPRW